MVAPILLPFLLGATGLGAASLLQPHVQNYGNRVQGRYNRDTLDGVDQSNPQALGSALFGGGLLSGKDYYGGNVDIRNTDANNAARIQSSQITAGPGYQNAALNQQQWAVDPRNPDSPNYVQPTPGYGQDYNPNLDPGVIRDPTHPASPYYTPPPTPTLDEVRPELVQMRTEATLLDNIQLLASDSRVWELERGTAGEAGRAQLNKLVTDYIIQSYKRKTGAEANDSSPAFQDYLRADPLLSKVWDSVFKGQAVDPDTLRSFYAREARFHADEYTRIQDEALKQLNGQRSQPRLSNGKYQGSGQARPKDGRED